MGSVQPNGSAASVSIWFMVFIEPISGAVGAYYDIIRCFRDLIMRCSGCFEADYGVIGVLRACFMVLSLWCRSVDGVFGVFRPCLWCFRCVPSPTMTCSQALQDFLSLLLDVFGASPSFFGCEVSEPDEYFYFLLVTFLYIIGCEMPKGLSISISPIRLAKPTHAKNRLASSTVSLAFWTVACWVGYTQ